MILDSVLFVVALGVAMAGLWMVGRGEAAGWMCVGVGAVASVAVPALTKPERRMLVSVMEALLALFVGGGFLCYADRLGATIGLNDYSVFPLLAALWALHELSLWWSGGRWRMAAPGEGRRHTWLVVQLVVAAVLMAGAYNISAGTHGRTGEVERGREGCTNRLRTSCVRKRSTMWSGRRRSSERGRCCGG